MSIISKETWDNLIPEDEKKKIKQDYQKMLDGKTELTEEEKNGAIFQMEWLIGKENLQTQPLTYEDVARELLGTAGMRAKYHLATVPCMGMKWDNKLQAIGRLLVVAKFLNKDWKPDWSDGEQEKYFIGIDNSENKKLIVKKAWFGQYEIVYFRTEELAKQAVAILGEDTVRLALDSNY